VQFAVTVPTIRDRVVQTAAKLLLEPIFEADFDPNAYGYRPKRSAQDAIPKVHKLLCDGYADVVDADLSKYFDTIPHSELLKCVARRIVDRDMLRLIKMWLKVPVAEWDKDGKPRVSGGKGSSCGTPQGGVVTPRTQKITSNLSGGCGSGGNRVRIDVCRKRLYVYDRCRARTMPRRPSASIARGSCFGKSINFPMRSSDWRKTVPFRRVKPTATSSTLSN